jgi:predicted RNA binding protein YcfA (HicA-like mRNA interferase family)
MIGRKEAEDAQRHTSDALLWTTEVATPSRGSSTQVPLLVVDGRLSQVMLTSGWTVGSHKRYRITVGGITTSTAAPSATGDIPTGTLRKIESDLAPASGRRWLL